MAAAPHEFGSTQVNLPNDLAAAIQDYQQRRINAVDLAPGDLEAQPHITVAFGVPEGITLDDVARALAGTPPISVTFGGLATFSEGDDGVPLHVEVNSPDLQQLHARLVDALRIIDTHASYTPHVTIAYIQPGSEPTYLADASPLAGRTAVFHTVTFSDRERNQTDVPLTGGSIEPMSKELLRAEIAKIDDDQQIVFGWASVAVGKDGALLVDRQNDVIFPEDLEHAAYDFVLNSRKSDTLHDEVTKAHLVESMVFTAEKMQLMGIAFVDDGGAVKKSNGEPLCLWWSGFFVPSAQVWKGIKDGDFTAFSIGGTAVREPLD